jgi:hypothetical protein
MEMGAARRTALREVRPGAGQMGEVEEEEMGQETQMMAVEVGRGAQIQIGRARGRRQREHQPSASLSI